MKTKFSILIVGLEAGADDYLSKPFVHAELMARVNTGIRILELEKSLQRANEKIKQMSFRDPLTSCYNKRYLKQYLPVEISRPKRYRRTMSIATCDINHLKTVNDTYGHQAGDVVLKNFSFCLKQAVRKKSLYRSKQNGRNRIIINVDIAGN